MYNPESVAQKTKSTGIMERLILLCLTALVCLSPLPLGGNRPAAWSIISLVCGGLLLLWVIGVFSRQLYIRVSLRHILWIVLPFILVLIWALLQTVIWAPELANPLWKITEDVLHTKLSWSISPNRYATIEAVMKLAAYGSAFWCSLQIGRNTQNAYYILKAIFIAGVFYAFYGMFDHFLGTEKILFIPKTAYIGSVTSTFINRNSYATYAAICSIICLALLVNKVFFEASSANENATVKGVLHNIYTKGFVYLHLLILLVASLVLSNSRAGVFSFILGVIVLIMCVGMSKPMRHLRKTLYITLITIVILLSGFVMQGGKTLSDRFDHLDNDIQIRLNIYKITLRAIGDFSYFGAGLGNFEPIFDMYRDSSLKNMTARIDHAHNTYLEMMLELGVIGFAVLMISFITVNIIFIKGMLRRQKDYIFPLTGFAVSVVVATHSLFDFSLEMPAIALTYSVILGVCCAQSWSTRERLSDTQNSSASNITVFIALIIGMAVFIIGIYLNVTALKQLPSNQIMAKLLNNKEVSIDELNDVISNQNSNANPAILSDLGEAEFTLAHRYGIFTVDGAKLLTEAKAHFKASLSLAPANSFAWQRLAYISFILGDSYEDVATYIYTSTMTGPYNKNLIFYRLELSMLVWDYFTDDQRGLIMNQIKIAAYTDSKKTENILKARNLFLD